MSRSAFARHATSAESVSLSPNVPLCMISVVDTESFSLMTGTIPISSSVSMVLVTFALVSLSMMPSLASRTHTAAVRILGKAPGISVHQLALTDGGNSLLLPCGFGTLCKTQVSDSDSDGAGTYQKNFFSAVHEIGNRPAKPVYASVIHFAVVVSKGRSAYLNYYSFRKIDCDTISAVSTQNRFLLGLLPAFSAAGQSAHKKAQ